MKLDQKFTMVTMGAALSLSSVFIQIKQVKAAEFTFTQSGYTLTTLNLGGLPFPPPGFPSPSNPYELVGSFTTSGTTITNANLNILDDVVNYDDNRLNLSISKSGSFDPSTNNLSLNVSTSPVAPVTVSSAFLNGNFQSNGGQFNVDFYALPTGSIHGYSGYLRGVSNQPAIVKEVPEPDWVAADALLLALGTFSLRSYVGKKCRENNGLKSLVRE